MTWNILHPRAGDFIEKMTLLALLFCVILKTEGILKKTGIIIAVVIALLCLAWFGTTSWRRNIASTYMSVGDNLLNQEKYSEAILEYKKVNFLSPRNAEANYKIGKAYYYGWNLSEASTYFQKAINYDQNYTPPFLAQAEIYLTNQKFIDAKETLNKVSEKDSSVHLSLFRTNFAVEDFEEAQKQLDEIKKEAKELKYYYKIILALAESNPNLAELEKNAQDLEPTKTKDQSAADQPIPNYVLTNQMIENCQKAVAQYLKISKETTRQIILSQVLIQGGDFAIAIPCLEKVVKENESYRDALVFLGQAYFLDHNYDNAKDILLKAKNIDPTFGPTWQLLGLTYEALGDKDLAKEAFDKANLLGKDLE